MRRRDQRGLVTVELAIGMVTATMLTAVLVNLSLLGVAKATCAEVGSQLARQLARGDDQAAAAAKARAPDGARFEVGDVDGGVSVHVTVPVTILGLGSTTVEADAWAALEPGASP